LAVPPRGDAHLSGKTVYIAKWRQIGAMYFPVYIAKWRQIGAILAPLGECEHLDAEINHIFAANLAPI
jgi:hypothetical protein